MGRVDGKIAFVTGGANGMGRYHALLLAREGATLVVTDMDEKGGHAVVDEINAEGGAGPVHKARCCVPVRLEECRGANHCYFRLC